MSFLLAAEAAEAPSSALALFAGCEEGPPHAEASLAIVLREREGKTPSKLHQILPQLDLTSFGTRPARQCIDVKPEMVQVVLSIEKRLRVFADRALQIFGNSEKVESPRTFAVAVSSQKRLLDMLLSTPDIRKDNPADRTDVALDEHLRQ